MGVPGAHHSWMLAHPGRAAEMMRQLLDAELGAALRQADGGTALKAGSALPDLTPAPVHYVGADEPRSVELERLRTHRFPAETHR